eukprot:10822682-Lingulodinium_polyedra.AAC.1
MAGARARPYHESDCLVRASRVRAQPTAALSSACRRRWVACPPMSTASTVGVNSSPGSSAKRWQRWA